MFISVRNIGKQFTLYTSLTTIQTEAVKRAAEYEVEQMVAARYEPLELGLLELTPTQREDIGKWVIQKKKQ